MTTTAPVRKVYDIPIVEPYRAPKELPQAPVPVEPFCVPVRQPDYVPARRWR